MEQHPDLLQYQFFERFGRNPFDRTFKGFMREGKIVGIETCVSSPVIFVRNLKTIASSLQRLYIAGEDAGYGGGIISAATDGIKIAEKILVEKY